MSPMASILFESMSGTESDEGKDSEESHLREAIILSECSEIA